MTEAFSLALSTQLRIQILAMFFARVIILESQATESEAE
jgi:hypothetical protein